MFTDYFDYSFFLIWSITDLLIVVYIHIRINKVLGKERKILPFVNKTFKYLNIVVAFFVLFFVAMAINDVINYNQNILVIFWSLIAWLAFYIFYKKINGFNYNEKGIVIPTFWNTFLGFEAIIWDKIERVEFDRDIKQNIYGFNIYIKSINKPIRCWIERKNMNEIKDLFLNNNIQL